MFKDRLPAVAIRDSRHAEQNENKYIKAGLADLTFTTRRFQIEMNTGLTIPMLIQISHDLSRRKFLAVCAACAGTPMIKCEAATDPSRKIIDVPSHHRPMFIDRAGITVHNLEKMVLFYHQIVGLDVMGQTDRHALLGIGGVGLIELVSEPAARPAPPSAAGLYHVAFEMPTRLDLARWIVFVARKHFQVTGLADHRVTESVYLNDPEGNGVEVYVSRPESQWSWSGGQVAMGVFDLDVGSLLQLVEPTTAPYTTAPASMRIGHIHLKVGDVSQAEVFYSELIGFDVTRRAPGVVFMSSGKYHHHVAANIWDSEGAGMRDRMASGLSWFSIAVTDYSLLDSLEARLKKKGVKYTSSSGCFEIEDPWGNMVRLSLRPA